MKPFLKDTILGGLAFLGLPSTRAVILMYHSIEEKPGHFNFISPETFRLQMAYLAEKKTPVISLAELVRRLQKKEPLGGAVSITFDDGYRDNLTNAFPVLKRYNFPATIFMVTNLVGRVDKNGQQRLSLQELQTLEASGLVDIEPHTKSHPRLSKLDARAVRDEVASSKGDIEEMLGKKATLFAYPYGDFDETTPRVVQECGYVAAVSVEEGTVRTGADLFRLPRVSIDETTVLRQFKGKISRAVDLYEVLKRIVNI